jgi:DNA-binding response OmpR family regulator
VNVLVADDSRVVRRLVATRLAADGFAVAEAEDGEEALEMVAREPPDVLVVGKVLPKLGGFTLVRAIRAHDLARNTRIIMLTNYGADRVRAEALGLGVDEFVTKPFSPKALSELVRR